MPGTPTARMGLAAHAGADLANTIDDTSQALVTAIDSKTAIYAQGTLAVRPVSTPGSPGIQGRFYFATDEAKLYYDAGTSWTEMVPAGTVTLAKLAAAVQEAVFSPGDLKHTLRSAASSGWILAQGQQNLSKAGLPGLWAVAQAEIALGNPLFNDVDASNFGIANLKKRVLISPDAGFALGALGGEETHVLTIAEMPSHEHDVIGFGGGAQGSFFTIPQSDNDLGSGALTDGNGSAVQVAGGGGAHNNMQLYAVVNVMVKT